VGLLAFSRAFQCHRFVARPLREPVGADFHEHAGADADLAVSAAAAPFEEDNRALVGSPQGPLPGLKPPFVLRSCFFDWRR